MENSNYRKIEDLLNGDDGILTSLRFGEGLNKGKVDELFDKIDTLDLENTKVVPKDFFDLIIDSIVIITSSIESSENPSVILEFLDVLTDKLKSDVY